MNRKVWLAALLLFLVTVVIRLPARWALRFAPANVICKEPDGTVWNGSCAHLQATGVSIGPVSWRLHALPLLMARVDADVTSSDARLTGQARVTVRSGERISAQGLAAQLELSSSLLSAFPEGWRGLLRVDLATVEFEAGHVKALSGTVDVDSLTQLSPAMPLGSYQLRFTPAAGPNGAINGTLRDTAGPLIVTGTVQYAATSGYEINGTVAARADATPELARAVELLGEADAQGRRPFSGAGSF
jgi:hypothetical protein